MEINEKFTDTTWPAAPEKATLEGKNKYLGFWFFLGGETVLFASLFATYLALKDRVPNGDAALAKDLFELPFDICGNNAFINKLFNKCLCDVSYEKS